MKFEWELIDTNDEWRTFRAKVFSGWLVMNISHTSYHKDGNMVFIADEYHYWNIKDQTQLKLRINQ